MTAQDCDYFPFSYIEGFFRILSEREDVEFLTYNDISFPEGSHFGNHYQEEYELWKKKIAGSSHKSKKIYLFIQHDVDRYPDRTEKTLDLQNHLGIRSSTLVFNKMIDRRLLRVTGEVKEKEYPVNFQKLSTLEGKGFAFGYHSNAYERSGFSLAKATEIFRQDVKDLREKLDIRFFSPHGGVRDDTNNSNSLLMPPPELNLKWVQNRHSLRFDGYYSDGGLNGKRDPNNRDLRDFLRTLEMGKRYRVLLHPQYYYAGTTPSNRLMDARWYRGVSESKDKSWQSLWAEHI